MCVRACVCVSVCMSWLKQSGHKSRWMKSRLGMHAHSCMHNAYTRRKHPNHNTELHVHIYSKVYRIAYAHTNTYINLQLEPTNPCMHQNMTTRTHPTKQSKCTEKDTLRCFAHHRKTIMHPLQQYGSSPQATFDLLALTVVTLSFTRSTRQNTLQQNAAAHTHLILGYSVHFAAIVRRLLFLCTLVRLLYLEQSLQRACAFSLVVLGCLKGSATFRIWAEDAKPGSRTRSTSGKCLLPHINTSSRSIIRKLHHGQCVQVRLQGQKHGTVSMLCKPGMCLMVHIFQ